MNTALYKFLLAATILLGVLTGSAAELAVQGGLIEIRVTDPSAQPIVGASVTIADGDQTLTGRATDSNGFCVIRISEDQSENWTVRVSSVGYLATSLSIPVTGNPTAIAIILEPSTVKLGSIAVYPAHELAIPNSRLSAEILKVHSRRSLVPTNPVGAIHNAEIDRVGSAHSSRIRVFGGSPMYHLNGLPIGADPDHYGMFHILPSTTIDQLRLELYGTDPSRGTPSTTELTTPVRFTKHRTAEFSLSTIDATGTVSLGTERLFAIGTLRKSVLDKLVTRLDIHSNRQTIPPTNFQDISLYAGWRLSPGIELFIDQYHVRDYLSYQVDSYVSNGDVDTYQHSARHYVAARLRGSYDKLILTGGVALHDTYEEYKAHPIGDMDSRRLLIDLGFARSSMVTTLRGDYEWNDYRLSAGIDDETVYRRTINLHQRNWNLLSPFASSNNPYVYQQSLNQLYGAYQSDDNERNTAAFLSGEREVLGWRIEAGLRGQHFENLTDGDALLYRLTVAGPAPAGIQARLFAGTFAENPAANILEPYQVVVYDWLHSLTPIKSRLLSLSLQYKDLTASIFTRDVDALPCLTPDFSRINSETGLPTSGFLSAQSTASANYRGVSLAFVDNAFFSDRISVQTSYAYSHARQTQESLTRPDDLDSPHRVRIQADYRIDRDITIGAEFAARSGYPYTPVSTGTTASIKSMYTPEYYENALTANNSERFPSSVSLNLFGEIKIRRGALFFSVANITNRANPIISTASGYIHDAGIMPTIGYRVAF